MQKSIRRKYSKQKGWKELFESNLGCGSLAAFCKHIVYIASKSPRYELEGKSSTQLVQHKHTQILSYARTFSSLILTVALEPTAFSILAARVLNAFHCLQASMETTTPPLPAAATFFLGEAAAFFLGDASFFLGAGFLAAGSALAATVLSSLLRVEDRVVRAIS